MEVFSGIRQLFFPRICPVCRKNLLDSECPVCAACQDLLKIPDYPRCPKCGKPLDTILGVCSECVNIPERPWIQGFGILPYHGVGGELVRRYKYHQDTALIPVLSWVLAAGWQKYGVGHLDYLIPIPISYRRFLERGFNQCEQIAEVVSQILKVPCQNHFLLRKHHVAHQAGLSFNARQSNIKDSFVVNKKFANQLSGKHILLIDDVLTTGATLAEATRVLQQYDAVVSVLTITRG